MLSLYFALSFVAAGGQRLLRYSLALMPVSFLKTRAKWAES